MSNNTT